MCNSVDQASLRVVWQAGLGVAGARVRRQEGVEEAGEEMEGSSVLMLRTARIPEKKRQTRSQTLHVSGGNT